MQDGEYGRVGEPTEAALRVLVEKLGIDSIYFLKISVYTDFHFVYDIFTFIGRADTDERTFEGEVSIFATAYQTIGVSNAKQNVKRILQRLRIDTMIYLPASTMFCPY